MTLTAFTVAEDAVEFLTDTMAYGPELIGITGPSEKLHTYPTVDAAIHVRGSSYISWGWNHERTVDLYYGGEFDEWAEAAEARLPEMWREYQNRKRSEEMPDDGGWDDTEVFHFGYSRARDRFVAMRFAAASGFQCEDLTEHDGVWSLPLLSRPAPTCDDEWMRLVHALLDAQLPRGATRRIAYGGDLLHTRLSRGACTTRKIGVLDQPDWRFRRQFIGTVNIRGQLGPCLCGSGQPAVVCHGGWDFTEPCLCGSGKTFGDCHRIDPNREEAQDYWFQFIDDFDRDRDEMRAAFVAAYPDVEVGHPQDVIGDVRRALSRA